MRPPALSPAAAAAWLLGLLVVLVAATRLLVMPFAVGGDSMRPSLRAGDRVLVDLWTYRQRAPRAGEIVLFRGPPPGDLPMIKRVASPPPFPDDRPRRSRWPGSRRIAEPGLWVLGDNAGNSSDSRTLGPVPRDRVIGRVAWRYWPPLRAGVPSLPVPPVE